MENTQALPGAGAPESGQLDNGKVWLNTAGVVDRIIRDFTIEAIRVVKTPGGMDKLDFLCRRMNGLFLGLSESDKYQRGSWNTPEQMGDYVLHALRINGETRNAVRDAFMVYMAKLLRRADPHNDFDGKLLDPLIADLRNALLGLSGASDYWHMGS